MKEKSLDNKLNGEFLDSMNYIQKSAIEWRTKKFTTKDVSDFWDEFKLKVPNEYVKLGLDYFLNKEDFSEGDTLDALGLLINYGKERVGDLPGVDYWKYCLEGTRKMKRMEKDKNCLYGKKEEVYA